jgi:hypothetical protein
MLTIVTPLPAVGAPVRTRIIVDRVAKVSVGIGLPAAIISVCALENESYREVSTTRPTQFDPQHRPDTKASFSYTLCFAVKQTGTVPGDFARAPPDEA